MKGLVLLCHRFASTSKSISPCGCDTTRSSTTTTDTSTKARTPPSARRWPTSAIFRPTACSCGSSSSTRGGSASPTASPASFWSSWRGTVPEVLSTFHALAKTGCVEFLAETYYHSLSFLYSRQEFVEQVKKHMDLIRSLFGQTPTVFRNTELIYNNDAGPAHRGDGLLRRDHHGRGRPYPGLSKPELRLPAQGLPAAEDAAEELLAQRRHRVPVLQPPVGGVAADGREVRPLGQRRQRQRARREPVHGLRDPRRAPVGGHGHLRFHAASARRDPQAPRQQLQDAQRGGRLLRAASARSTCRT